MASPLAAAYFSAMHYLGVNRLLRARRTGAVVLCYHNVVGEPGGPGEPGLHLGVRAFREQMEWLQARHEVVPLTTLTERVRLGRSVAGLAAVTFDDGYLGVLTHALPVLADLTIPCTIFVATAAATTRAHFWWDNPAAIKAVQATGSERMLHELGGDANTILVAVGGQDSPALPRDYLPAGWELLRAAASDLVEYGAHTATHRTMTRLADAALDDECVTSRVDIEEHLRVRPTTFAYPYGMWDGRVRAAVQRAGFTTAVTLGGGDVLLSTDPLLLPRINIPASISLLAFRGWVSGFSRLRSARSGPARG